MASSSVSDSVAYIFNSIKDPLFTIPFSSFVEQNCEGFTDKEASYKELHEQYRHVITAMLEALKQDAQMSDSTFFAALQQVVATSRSDPDYEFAKPLIAVEQYDLFVSIMIEKNVELQEQVISMLLNRNNQLPEAFDLSKMGKSPALTDDEAMLERALRESRDEYEREQASRQLPQPQQLPHATPDDYHRSESPVIANGNDKQTENENENDNCDAIDRKQEEASRELEIRKERELQERLRNTEKSLEKLHVANNDIDAFAVREERERLLRAKQESREEVLEEETRRAASQRPKSSRVAQKAMSAAAVSSEPNSQPQPQPQSAEAVSISISSGDVAKSGLASVQVSNKRVVDEPIKPKLIENDREAAIRRAIAARLKQEVIKK